MWNLEGMRVKGGYLDGDQPVSGKVVLSRVCYGGGISHHIKLDEGFQYKNTTISREAGEVVIVDHKYITEVRD
jgi:predicted small secreted protein